MPFREFYLNSDFDVSLRGGPSLLDSPDPTYVHEMAWHFLFAGGTEDSLIVHRLPPADFLEYLAGKGLPPPRLVVHPACSPQAEFIPFGWNAHAEERAKRYAHIPPHPDPEIVKVANSRAFSLGLEKELEGEEEGEKAEESGRLFDSLDDLEAFLRSRSEPEGWVIKGDHGHAGTANRRVPLGPCSEEDRIALARLMQEHGRVVAEPWHERLMDMAVNFTVEKGGRAVNLCGHQLLNSRDGAFLGVKILSSRMPPEPWAESLASASEALAERLDALGYFGPLSVDAYVRKSPQGPRLRPWVDINARQSMALPAHGLARRLPGKTLLWMWSKPRKLNLPDGYAALDGRLGAHAFDPASGTGILAVSPLRFASASAPDGSKALKPDRLEAFRPKRIGFLFSARDEEHLQVLQTGFAQALDRP